MAPNWGNGAGTPSALLSVAAQAWGISWEMQCQQQAEAQPPGRGEKLSCCRHAWTELIAPVLTAIEQCVFLCCVVGA